MTTAKIAVSVPAGAVARARREVRAGRARSLSAFVTTALQEKLDRDDLAAVLDAMDAAHGRPDGRARAWARRLLSRSS